VQPSTQSNTSQQADAVITWVDGDDPHHLAKRMLWQSKVSKHTSATQKVRFTNFGELRYCVLSILKYCDFVRNIYIITDGQTPLFINDEPFKTLCKNGAIQIIDHSDLFDFDPTCLPTFNSRAIEAVLHKIPGLLEHFISFNDDFIILKKLAFEDFFILGKPVFRGSYKDLGLMSVIFNFWRRISYNIYPSKPLFSYTQQQAAIFNKSYGCYFKLDHTPRPFLRSEFIKMFDRHPAWMRQAVSFKFRHAHQASPLSLYVHRSINNNRSALLNELNLFYLSKWDDGFLSFNKKLEDVGSDPYFLFACIQNMGALDLECQERLSIWLDEVVG